ncbi:MAG TPA: nitrilase-related carbon-nitrogen hydrolase [Gemmatimonadales bacterium]|nr:nitrilase-related carbon-nitrogen hydrolase [Gemmatimonadales bacterium]
MAESRAGLPGGAVLPVAVVQLGVEDGEPERNLEHALSLMDASPGAALYLLPELWTTGYAHATWAQAADRATPRIVPELASACDRLGAYIGGSMVTRNERGNLVNRFWLFSPTDSAPVVYDKAHLFAPMEEHRYLEAGGCRVRTPVRGFTAALSVCFDLRFPEQYRLDAVAGAQLFLVVAEWPAQRAETMTLLARARAAENQAFLVLCNRVGTGGDGTRFGGGSLVVSPGGQVLVEGGETEQVLRTDLDIRAVHQARSSLTVLECRRPGIDFPAD